MTRAVRKWYGRYEDAGGVLKQVPLCEDKQSAQAMLTDIIRRIERIRAGIIDPLTEQLSGSVADHVEGFRAHLEAKARSESHVGETLRLINNVIEACRIRILADLQSADDRIEQHLAQRRKDGASHRTVNADLAAIRAFCRWLVHRNRMMRDPTAALEDLNVEEDRRLERRALTEEEAEKLMTATVGSTRVFRRLRGQDRAMLYLLSQRTGLRRRELTLLTPAAFDFSATPVVLTVPAAHSKRRRLERLPIPEDVAAAFQAYLAEKRADQPVWPGGWWRKSAEMIRRDLTDAGIEAEDQQGRVIDFHGQRTTFITNLSLAGVPPALAQKLARHSDVRLTLGTYTQLDLRELGAAVDRLTPLAPNRRDAAKSAEDRLCEEQLAELTAAWRLLTNEVREQLMATLRQAIDMSA